MYRDPFLESPETFQAHFGWHDSLCIFKTKASRGTKLSGYFNIYSLYNIWKDQLYRICGSESYEWFFGPEKFSKKRAPAGNLKKMHVCTVFQDGVEYMSLSSGFDCPISPSTLVWAALCSNKITCSLFSSVATEPISSLLLTAGLHSELKDGLSLFPKNLSIMGVLIQKGDFCFSLFSLTSSSSRAFVSQFHLNNFINTFHHLFNKLLFSFRVHCFMKRIWTSFKKSFSALFWLKLVVFSFTNAFSLSKCIRVISGYSLLGKTNCKSCGP